MKLFEEKLGELDPGFGVELMILAAPEVEAWSGAQDALPEPARSRNRRWARTARSISPTGWRCGWARRTSSACCRATAICRSACRSRQPSRARLPPDGAWARARLDLKGARPTRLLQRPEPVDVTALLPDDPPRQFRWRQHAHRVVRVEGPERMANEWWRPRPDGKPMPPARVPPVRDYYRVEDDDGGRFWLFRDGPYNVAAAGQPTARGSCTDFAPRKD